MFEILQQMLQKVWRKSNDKDIQKVKKVLIFVSLLNNPVFFLVSEEVLQGHEFMLTKQQFFRK